MASRLVIIDAESIVNLLVHYSEGIVPIDSKVKEIQVSKVLPRWVNFIVESKDWKDTPFEAGDGYGGQQPMMIRYEGKRVMALQHLKDPIQWGEEGVIEAPKRL